MPDQTKLILAIDLGTSGPKVAVATSHGKILAYDFEPVSCNFLPNGGAEQDPAEWWHAVISASKRVLNQTQVDRRKVVAACSTAQWSGTVAVDRAGNHLMNAIIWMDARGQKYVVEVTGGFPRVAGYGLDKLARWIPKTGGVPGLAGKDPVAHILFIKNEFPEIYTATYKFLEPKDYLNLRLSGKFAASFDSITLHWVTDNRNPTKIIYDNDLLRLAKLDRAKLPALKQATDVLGPIRTEVADELGLNPNVQIVAGTPDIHSAAIGSGAVQDFEPHLYIGTSSWLSCHVPYKKTDLLHNMASLPSAIAGRYLIANEQQTSGACLDFLRDNFLPKNNGATRQDYETLNKMAQEAPAGSKKVIFTPWLYGERTPVEDHALRGGFHNIALNTKHTHLIRAGFEGVAFNSRWLLKYVEKFVGKRFEGINMIGGGAKSHLWCQIHADVLNRKIRQVKDPILANVRGAACLASVALGFMTFPAIKRVVEIEQIFEPDPKNRAIYDELFSEFLNIYKQNKKMYARLNRT